MSESPSSQRPAYIADFTLKVGELDTEVLKVTRFEGTEGISELFSFHLELCSDNSDIPFADVVGKPCVLEIGGVNGSRFVNGIIRQFARTGEGSHLTNYAAEIVPVHWLLTKRYRARIFQESNCSDMTVRGIIEKVLTDAGIPDSAYRFALQGEYTAHEYIVQYRESEFDFISRLMEHEGIFYFFEHAVDGHTMVIADSGVAHVATPNQAEFVFRDISGLRSEDDQEYFFNVEDRQEIRTGSVSLDDFNFKQPPLQLRTNQSADEYSSLFFNEYPGQYDDASVGNRYTQARLEEFQCGRRVQRMTSNIRVLLPGFKYTLQEHPSDALNGEYLVTHLTHRVSQVQSAEEEAAEGQEVKYDVEVRTIPAEVPFRSPRKTPRPVVEGSQTALVVGPAGEEIYTDKYGRVKVQFHWDQEGQYNENSSRWIRVSQGSAGGQYGIMFLPRVGHEVVVDFLEGNPDEPIITGRVYNNDLMPPYTLPDEKTKSVIKTHSSKGGGGTNEIRFEDLKDKEQLFIQAQRQMDTRVKASHFHTVGGGYHLHVGWKDKGCLYELVHEDKHVHVKGDVRTLTDTDESHKVDGKVSIDVAGTLSTSVGSDVVDKFGSNHKHEVTSTYACKAMSIKLEAAVGIELKCGGSSIILTPAAIFIQGGPLVNINSGAGPPVAPIMAMATTPDVAEDAGAADKSEPGHDVTYNPDAATVEELEIEPGEFEPVVVVERETTWIGLELVDEMDQPVASEHFEITGPDGRVRRGRTDANGRARISGIPPGTYQISFPRLDEDAWERRSGGSSSGGEASEAESDASET